MTFFEEKLFINQCLRYSFFISSFSISCSGLDALFAVILSSPFETAFRRPNYIDDFESTQKKIESIRISTIQIPFAVHILFDTLY